MTGYGKPASDRSDDMAGRVDWAEEATLQKRRAERAEEALKRLQTHPLLTRRAGPLEQHALRIVRDALSGEFPIYERPGISDGPSKTCHCHLCRPRAT